MYLSCSINFFARRRQRIYRIIDSQGRRILFSLAVNLEYLDTIFLLESLHIGIIVEYRLILDIQ